LPELEPAGHKIIAVEHVLPQSPKPGSHWTVSFTSSERDYWLHRLANLVVLNRRKNSAEPTLTWATRKSATSPLKGKVSPFALITTVITVPSGRQRSSANDKRSF
jgi:hypothetical protein